MILEFPPVETADEHGLVAIGGDLEVPSLILAYSQGIFPWPIADDTPMTWFCPDPRGIIQYNNLHISNSLKKVLNRNQFDIRFNTNFEEVIKNCKETNNRKDSLATWITDELMEAYIQLFYAGYAYSIESYLENKLVGGIYGVKIGNFASGESMFYKESNASKVALVKLLEYLHQQNIGWLDTQMLTPVVKNLGGEEITRKEFLLKLEKCDFPTIR